MKDVQKIELWRGLFYGNQRQFGRRIVYLDDASGKQVRRYHPVTKHTGDGGQTEYEPLSSQWVKRHIEGQEELLIYILHSDLTIRFAAVDFDTEHNFEDVKRTQELLASVGIVSHIARSTAKGYHLYMFFTDSFRSYYIIAVFEWLMDKSGFREEAQYNKRMMPETFPRNVGAPNLGHGIKPPLWGAGLPDHNCWVDAQDNPIENQWEHTHNIWNEGRNQTKKFVEMVENNAEMELRQGEDTVDKPTARRLREKEPYKPPTSGDFNRVIAKCPAVNKIWNKPPNMQSHDERVALLAFAKATANGIEIIREKYNNSSEVQRQIDYAIDTNQKPWTCEAMMQRGFCDKRTPCLKKLPPAEKIDGKIVVNPHNIPEDQWPAPSCVRYAFDSDLDAAVLKDEIQKFKGYQGEDREAVLENIIRNLVKIETKKRIELEDLLAETKVFKNRTSLNKYIKQVEIAVNKEAAKILTSIDYGEYELGQDARGYVSYTTTKNGEKIPNRLTNFKMFMENDVSIIGMTENNRNFSGYIELRSQEDINHVIRHQFTMEAKVFYSNLLIQEIGKIAGCGVATRTSTRDVDAIRYCIVHFGRVNVLNTLRYEEYGMRIDGTSQAFRYMAGDYIYVDKDAIAKDTNTYVDLSHHEVARGLKLKMITDGQLRDVANHIVKDVLTCHEPHVIFTCLAHSLQATIHESYMPMPDKPTVWIQGLTGSGKTFVAEIAAAFHGDARTLMLNARTTTKSMESYGAAFKDALLVIDDYKNNMSEMGMKTFIQNVYDSRSRGRLKQNGKQNNAPRVRSLVMVTAEDILGAEASTMARIILIRTESTSHMSEADRAREKVIRENMPLYPGFTANFIKYMLNHTKEHVASNYERAREELVKKMGDTQNGNRICNNLAANYTTWSYFCDFLLMYRIISKEQSIEFKKLHWRNMQTLAHQMASLCLQEQASTVFVTALRELLSSGRYYIEGLTDGINNSDRIGFAERDEKGKLICVYLHPAQAVKAVKSLQSDGERTSHTRDAIGQQLVQAGVIQKTYDGMTMVRKTFRGMHPYVWACDPEKLGLMNDTLPTPPVPDDVPMDPFEAELRAVDVVN